MKYRDTMLCSGYSHELKPCKWIRNCDLCTGLFFDIDGNAGYMCGRGAPDFKCKRDNLDWKPLTTQQFIELYNKTPIEKRRGDIQELLKWARITGVVED